MTNHIMELAAQAKVLDYSPDGIGGKGYVENGDAIERFAKLIIEECLSDCKDVYHADAAIAKIRHRFGIV